MPGKVEKEVEQWAQIHFLISRTVQLNDKKPRCRVFLQKCILNDVNAHTLEGNNTRTYPAQSCSCQS